MALARTYGKPNVSTGPQFLTQTTQGGRIVLKFDSVGTSLVSARPGKLNSFAIAGPDMQWHWADAVIEGGTVVVSSPEIQQPVAVRYAWAMNPSQRNLLYNAEGFPASPFRTDSGPLFDADRDEVVEVVKPKKPEGYQSTDWARPAISVPLQPEKQ